MLFEFVLRPIDDVALWGKYPGLSWFALTDGFFRLRLGNEYLLYSSDEDVQEERIRRGCPHPYPQYEAWTDYQVARIWEDTLYSLPRFLQPLPEELCRIMELDWDERDQWCEQILENLTDNEQYSSATEWIDRGQLCSAGAGGARIDVWSSVDQIHFQWYDKGKGLNRIFRMPRRTFLEEVYSFHDRLMAAMQKRVEAALEIDWESRYIELDLEALWKEQEDRSQWLSRAMDKKILATEIEDAMAILKQINGWK